MKSSLIPHREELRMKQVTGIRVTAYTNANELLSARDGKGSVLIAYTSRSLDNPIEISAVLEACDFVGGEIRINIAKANMELAEAAQMMGEQFGKAIEASIGSIMAKS